MSGEIVNVMDSVSVSGQIIRHMKDISTWTNSMLLERLHFQMEGIMRVNGIMINSMGMEFRNCQMEIFMMGLIRITKNMGLVS